MSNLYFVHYQNFKRFCHTGPGPSSVSGWLLQFAVNQNCSKRRTRQVRHQSNPQGKLNSFFPSEFKSWGRGCILFGERNKERNGETPLKTGRYFETIIKQWSNSAFAGFEEFRSRRVLSTSTSAFGPDDTFLDLHNSSYPTQPHSIIAKYLINSFIMCKLNYKGHNMKLSLHRFVPFLSFPICHVN